MKSTYKSFGVLLSDPSPIAFNKNIFSKIDLLVKNDSPYWLHFENPSNNLSQFLNKNLAIPKDACSILFAQEVRPRCTKIDNGFVLVVQNIKTSNLHTENDFPSLRFWVTAEYLVSFSTGRIDAISDALKNIRAEENLSPINCISIILNHLIAYLEETIHDIDDKLYQTESHFQYDEHMTANILLLRQDIIYLRRYIFPQRDAMINFTNKLTAVDTYLKPVFKELSDNMIRHSESIEMIRERAMILQDHLSTQINELMNKRVYVLTIIMLIFTPAFFIMGLFSMYLPIPGMDSSITWWGVCTVIATTSYLLYKTLKRKQWI